MFNKVYFRPCQGHFILYVALVLDILIVHVWRHWQIDREGRSGLMRFPLKGLYSNYGSGFGILLPNGGLSCSPVLSAA